MTYKAENPKKSARTESEEKASFTTNMAFSSLSPRYSYLVPEMIWWKFHENRTLGSVKTNLPVLTLTSWVKVSNPFTQPNLNNQNCQTKHTKSNLSDQTYQIQPTKLHLQNQTY